MDFNTIIRELIIIYGSSTVTSLLFTKLYHINRMNKAYEQSKRKLKFKELSLENGRDLVNLKRFCKTQKIASIIMSSLPIAQIPYTISRIFIKPELYNEFFDEQIEQINKNELLLRKKFLEEIKKAEVIPHYIQQNLDDEEYLPNEEEYVLVRYLNMGNEYKKKL